MEWRLLSVEEVIILHDSILGPNELPGLAKDRSLAGALSRVEFRVQYGLIDDAFDLAAMYAVAIAQAHAFNDANKRTAYAALETILYVHGISISFQTKEIGDVMIKVAQGLIDEADLAVWLRTVK